MGKKQVPTEDEDLKAALEETDMMDDADFGQQEIGEGDLDGLIDEDFDDIEDDEFNENFEFDDDGYF